MKKTLSILISVLVAYVVCSAEDASLKSFQKALLGAVFSQEERLMTMQKMQYEQAISPIQEVLAKYQFPIRFDVLLPADMYMFIREDIESVQFTAPCGRLLKKKLGTNEVTKVPVKVEWLMEVHRSYVSNTPLEGRIKKHATTFWYKPQGRAIEYGGMSDSATNNGYECQHKITDTQSGRAQWKKKDPTQTTPGIRFSEYALYLQKIAGQR